MDIERMKKLLKSGIEAGNKVKAVREVVKTYTTQKQDMYDDTAEIFKPSIEVQKSIKESIDENQNQLISGLLENQKQFFETIGFTPMKQIPYEDEEDGEDEEFEDAEEKAEEKPTKEIKTFNLNKGINADYKKFLSKKKWNLPMDILEKGDDVNVAIEKVKGAIKRAEEYIEKHTTKKGELRAKLKIKQKNKVIRDIEEIEYMEDYLERLKHIKAAPKYKGEGIYTEKEKRL